MEEYVKCWHCGHYIWFSLDSENRIALCDIKKRGVFARDEVCKEFIKNRAVYTKKKIPDYCINYK